MNAVQEYVGADVGWELVRARLGIEAVLRCWPWLKAIELARDDL